MEPATIKLFLVNGTPNGLRTAELSNWSGKAIAAPRNELAGLLSREEMTSAGVYLLSGVDSESGETALYVGEAEDVSNRLKGHSGKDFWNAATVFVSKDENLTKAHIRYLEGKLIELLASSPAVISMNSVKSGAKLPESDAAEMDGFLERVLQLLPVLGITAFSAPSEIPNADETSLICKIKGLEARGRRTAGGFTVYAGSQAVLKHRPSATTARSKRDSLVAKGFLEEAGKALVFTRNVEFSSPSMAASVVRGGASNGLINWKNSQGKTLKEIEGNNT